MIFLAGLRMARSAQSPGSGQAIVAVATLVAVAVGLLFLIWLVISVNSALGD